MTTKENYLPRSLKFLAFTSFSVAVITYQYKYVREKYPDINQNNIWKPFMSKFYPILLRGFNHDNLHYTF